MKKITKVLSVLLVGVLTFGMVGCGSGDTESAASTSDSGKVAAANEDVTLHILMEDVPDTTYVQDLVADFEDETGIKVDIESVNYSAMHEKLLTSLTAKKGDYDVLVVDSYWTGEFTSAGWLEDLTPYVERDGFDTSQYVDSFWDMFNLEEDKTTLIPFYNYMFSLVYRTDIFGDEDLCAAYKADTGKELDLENCSLADYVEICKFVTDYFEDDGITGTVCQAMRGDPIAMEYMNYLYSNGGDIIDEDGNVVINSDAAVEALDLYMDNIKNGSTAGSESFSLEETYNVFSQGQAASFISYNWQVPTLNQNEESSVQGLVSLVNVPGGHALNAGWAWGIPSNATNKEASWEFIKYIESFDSCKTRALAGGSPTRSDVFNDADCVEKYPYYEKVLEIMETSKPIPVLEDTPSLIDYMGQELSSAVAGEKTSQQALDDLAGEIKALIG